MQHDRTAKEKALGGFPTLNKQGQLLEPVILAYGIILEQKIRQQTPKNESTASEMNPSVQKSCLRFTTSVTTKI